VTDNDFEEKLHDQTIDPHREKTGRPKGPIGKEAARNFMASELFREMSKRNPGEWRNWLNLSDDEQFFYRIAIDNLLYVNDIVRCAIQSE
jgi:hypothetical protein